MLGLAQLSFIEKEKKDPWGPSLKRTFPFLEKLLGERKLEEIDFALAEYLLRPFPGASEDVAALICHLSIAARAGHLCIKIDAEQVAPDPCSLWGGSREDSECSLSSPENMALRKMIIEAVHHLPEGLAQNVEREIAASDKPLCRSGRLYYLQRYWQQETLFVSAFSKLLAQTPTIPVDLPVLNQKLDDIKSLLFEQMQAIKIACKNNFTIITGGPGTGKTYTAGQFLKLFWECLPLEQRASCQIALAAPTGKAAANLESSIRKSVQGIADFPNISAQTLHGLLGIRSSKFKRQESFRCLPADVLIVDESSMIDVNLMGRLIEAIKPGARLILLGDQHQLPPIEAGALFHDLVHLLKSSHRVISLTTCLRAELKEIVNLAQRINAGNQEEVLSLLSDGCIRHVAIAKDNELQRRQELLEYTLSLLPDPTALYNNPFEMLKAFNKFRLLAPLRKGFFGVDTMNRLLYQASMKKAPQSGQFMVPIMIVRNDYKNELFNGEVGVLVKQSAVTECCLPGDFALFPAKEGIESTRRIPALLLPKYEYAYCLSVYKSQGSEFDHVLLALPLEGQFLTRELLYTAVTRARKQLEIWGPRSTLLQMIHNAPQRFSGIVKL